MATYAGLWDEEKRGGGVGLPARVQQITFTPSRRSCTPTGTGRLRGLTRPSDTNLRGPRLHEETGALPAQSPPTPPRRREANPTRPAHPEALPSSHLPARDAHSRARPPVRPGPAIRGSPSPWTHVARVPPSPEVKPTRLPPPRSTRSTPLPPPGPARAHAPPGPLPAALAHSRGLAQSAPQLDRPARAARSRERSRPPGHPVLTRGVRGRGRAAVAVGPHSPPSRAGSECAAFRCEAMRGDVRGPRFSAGCGGDVVGGLRRAGVSPARFTSQKHGDPRN